MGNGDYIQRYDYTPTSREREFPFRTGIGRASSRMVGDEN
jgi:hypothetical protein